MEKRRPGCMGMSSMLGGNRTFCPPLQWLMDEHRDLNERMNQCTAWAEEWKQATESEACERSFELNDLVSSFQMALAVHSKREEDWLFPMLAGHIGREMGPIAVMEYEHEMAKDHLQLCRQTYETNMDDALNHLLVSFEILNQHFFKEENVLFPMAQQLLSEAEKEQLLEMFRS